MYNTRDLYAFLLFCMYIVYCVTTKNNNNNLCLSFFLYQGAFTQIKCSSPLYIGGVPNYDITKTSAGVLRPFSGTVQKVLEL